MAKQAKRKPELTGLFFIGFSALLTLALCSFQPNSPGENWLGFFGFGLAYISYYILGLGSFALALYSGWAGFRLLIYGEIAQLQKKNLYFGLLLLSLCLLFNLLAEKDWLHLLQNKVYKEQIALKLPYKRTIVRYNLGGVPLYYLYRDLPHFNLQQLLSNFGIGMVSSIAAIIAFLSLTNLSPRPLIGQLKKGWLALKQYLHSEKGETEKKPILSAPIIKTEKKAPVAAPTPIYPVVKMNPVLPQPVKQIPKPTSTPAAKGSYELPPIDLLKNPKKVDQPSLKKDLKKQAEILEETLKSFGIEAKVGEIYPGPTITLFEVHPAVGVKVQKIKTLENDIALNLQAKSIRIIAPIPGKAAVGVEIPSIYPQEVSFKELLMQYQSQSRKFHIPVLLGKSVHGENVMLDLTKMPHCLIAGATGSGKSVCINTLILSILMNARPDEIKLLMIDPKKVELTGYSRLPHMLAPVITEAHGAYAALNWLVKEMQHRYEILKQLGLRNITAFNSRKIDRELEASLSTPIPESMFAIVAIIDEFADLMMASSSDLETPIARIAQMARAVGIHLVLATQRPSREVITGLIKANFPTRIAFKVSSRINSQIILDENGAESLLGNGDMLFMPPGSSLIQRAQGVFISDEEIEKILSFIAKQAGPNYLIRSFDTMSREEIPGLSANEEAKDSLYDEARSIVIETGSASTTYLQRKLKIGYARAASLMDELEMKGVISPQEGAKPRRVLTQSPLSKSAD